LINASESKHTDHTHVINHATIHAVTLVHFYQSLTLNNDTITFEQKSKHKTVCHKNFAKLI